MKFSLFDEIRVATSINKNQRFIGSLGIIVGIGEDEGEGLSYAVIFPPNHITYSFWDTELELTGRKADPQEFSKHGVIRIQVDSTGRGRVIDSK